MRTGGRPRVAPFKVSLGDTSGPRTADLKRPVAPPTGMVPAGRTFLDACRRGAPFALLLFAALVGTLALGAHQSNATPSASKPFGWEGPASFRNGVAMVRGDLVLATTFPSLAFGALALAGLEPRRHGAVHVLARVSAHALLVVVAVLAATAVGVAVADEAAWTTLQAFATATTLLALAYYSLGLLAAVVVPRHALVAVMGAWFALEVALERGVRIAMYRLVGYHEILAGHLPTWFLASQALAPTAAYRGILILWDRGLMDALERAALGKAALPGWVNPLTFAVLLAALWILLPLALAAAVWRRRGRERATPARATRAEAA